MANKEEQISLSNLAPAPGARHRRKRLGIGEGSGSGKTCGKGTKGQKMRSGYNSKVGFEGGQMPLQRRLPKVGFVSRKKTLGENVFAVVNLASLEALDVSGPITLEVMREKGLLRSARSRVKVLGGGTLKKSVVVEAHAVSASAKLAIEGAGGQVKLV